MPKKIRLNFVLVTLAVIVGGAEVFAQTAKPKVTLHDRVKKANGKLVLKYKPSRATVYPNVQELAKRSDLIIVGRVLSHKSNLTQDERFITQDFLIKVHEMIKGDLARGRSVLLSMPGGTHRFSDGGYAAIMPVGYKHPEDGGIYVFFLKSKDKNSTYNGQRLVSERQGMFALTAGTVQPADLAVDDPMNLKYREMTAASFLKEIHKAVPRKKKQSSK